jgi:hypothetical protein
VQRQDLQAGQRLFYGTLSMAGSVLAVCGKNPDQYFVMP